jgi:secreted PhoX family phosphatase
MTSSLRTCAQAFEASEDIGRNTSDHVTLGDVIAARYNRRELLKGALGAAAIAATLAPLAVAAGGRAHARVNTRFGFEELTAGVDENHYVAGGYDADVLIRWGDPVLPGAPTFDPMKQTAAGQKLQFGYNNDYLGYLPMLNAANPSDHGLLVANLEYTNEELMFPGVGADQMTKGENFTKMTKELVDIEMAAHGGAVIEIKRDNGKWQVVAESRYARRIDADTVMEITGPAAGHERMKTKADPTGRRVLGMLNNCAGGLTPWGTWLSCEENFHGYFWGKTADDHSEARNFQRYGVAGNWYAWGKWYDRFDVSKEPNEANRFGWIVEIDPFDPVSTPKKRTALGRMKHEGAAGIINRDGRYIVYTGDDERFDYVYKFVTRGAVSLDNRGANQDLLDEGILYAAKYDTDGTGKWLPLVHDQGPLTAANGFNSQADVLIETRRAGDLLGATKMDRPEDVEASPKTNKVYVILTNNEDRKDNGIDAANPRANNRFGHIIEMTPQDGDHAAVEFSWEILLKCGDPAVATVGASFSSATTKDGWFGMPDNCAIDGEGRLWIATDGNSDRDTSRSDGLWALETEGESHVTSKLFFRCPVGAELCGPVFTPDDETLFVAVQHPGDEGLKWKAFGRISTFEDPSTRWPDFKPTMPPRPAVLAITKRGGGKIGT